jgi:hypothetical protein
MFHSNILCAMPQYLRTASSNEWAEKRDGNLFLEKSNLSP